MSLNSTLYSLGQAVDAKLSGSSTQSHTLDQINEDGSVSKYGKLGEFAKQIDQSARRNYVEEGFSSISRKPKNIEIIFQEPDVSVLVKKRAFSSLVENFRLDHMNEDERLFLKTTKILFKNKAEQISAYERLTKIQRIADTFGTIDDALLPMISDSADTLSGSSGDNSLTSTLNILKKARTLSKRNIYTNWVPDLNVSTIPSQIGLGTGVIEFTTMTSVSTTNSINSSGGNCNITFTDPYKLMVITDLDIETAINQATNLSAGTSDILITQIKESVKININTLNSLRSKRSANKINFELNKDAFLGKKITAILDSGKQIRFNDLLVTDLYIDENYIDESAKFNSEYLGSDGLRDDEIKLFTSVISNYTKLLSLQNGLQNTLRNKKSGLNELRNKLRLHYGSKLTIQPMDVVHVFMNSRTTYDEQIIQGFKNSFTNFGVKSDANALMGKIGQYLNTDNIMATEKSIFVGSNFPSWLWILLKNQIVNTKNGSHVFAGIVDDATRSGDGGNKTANITCNNNFQYFNYGMVNFQPSIDVYNGPLYDPLTPFDIKFDSITGIQKNASGTNPLALLKENEDVSNNSSFSKQKGGINAGKPLSNKQDNSDCNRNPNSSVSKVYYDSDAFVYKWKEGIGTYVVFGDSYNRLVEPQKPVAIAGNVFAGQDIMNILSLTICGEPYNYLTFLKGAREFDTIGTDPVSKKKINGSYYESLISGLVKRNNIYGNFVPFKSLYLNKEAYSNVLNSQSSVLNTNDQLNNLLEERARAATNFLNAGLDSNQNLDGASEISTLQEPWSNKIADLDQQIQVLQTQLATNLTDSNNNLNIIGDDVSVSSVSSFNSDNTIDSSDAARREVNYLTQRLFWKVKANEDQNLFIVDDYYDKDYDVQVFEKTIAGNFENFSSSYMTAGDKLNEVSQKLHGLELFADTQGHIRARFPQYNRIPSSVFQKMLRMKSVEGIRVYPEFLDNIFKSQFETAISNIEIIEDQIRLYFALIGIVKDDNIISQITSNQDSNFSFLSRDNGKILYSNLSSIGSQSPDQLNQINDTSFLQDNTVFNDAFVQNLEKQNTVRSAFSIMNRLKLVQSALVIGNNSNAVTQNSNPKQASYNIDFKLDSGWVDTINQRIFQKTGQLEKLPDVTAKFATSLEVFNITKYISGKISDRQKLVTSLANILKNIKQANDTENNKDFQNSLLYPNLYGSKNIPQSIAHLIEDESFDDLGPNSGKRYVIKNSQIKNYSISESHPNMTSVTVNGHYQDQWIANAAPDIKVNGGNALTSITAVDYDLWRMYGMSAPNQIEAPFITDIETQGAPFAVSLLNKARAEILTCSLTMIGNEFIQPGEVYYLEEDDLLFYCESVTHSYQQNSTFTTTLTLKFGHKPGHYIPTTIDLIGKVFYKNKDVSNIINRRQDNVFDQNNLGVLLSSNDGQLDMSGFPGNANSLKNILYVAKSVLDKANEQFDPVLEIRIYFNSKSNNSAIKSSNSKNLEAANFVKSFLKGTADIIGTSLSDSDSRPNLNYHDKERVVVKAVDLGLEEEYSRFASKGAFALARQLVDSGQQTISDIINPMDSPIQKVEQLINSYIIDCWIVT